MHIKHVQNIELLNGYILTKSSIVYENNPDINKSINLIVDDFINEQYVNENDHTQQLTYNLFVPTSLREGSNTDNKIHIFCSCMIPPLCAMTRV